MSAHGHATPSGGTHVPGDTLVFEGATVADGSGEPAFVADVLIEGDRIRRIAPPGSVDVAAASRRVEARGHVLAPGFIDMHAHSDLAVVTDRSHTAKLAQGVTTEVLGQDGIAYAPVDDAVLRQVRRQIAGWNGNPPDDVFTWRSVAEYLSRLGEGTPTNTAYLVPQGNLRMMVVGQENRPATSVEQGEMNRLLAEGLDAGAVGMSSGLTYTPGMYASTAELEALCRVVADRGGYYAPHTRSYGGTALDAYAEVIGIARRTGCALHLTHATLNFEANRNASGAFLTMIEQALSDGVDLTLDSYPYLPGATTLSALLPSWAAEGGPDALLARLRRGIHRDRIAHELDVVGADGFHGEVADWSVIEISGVGSESLAPYVGRTIADIARSESRQPVDVVIDILVGDELATGVLMHVGHEHNVRAIVRSRVHTAGSDGILVGSRPHPRAWGTFPRYLARYVRELGVLSLEEAVRHLAATPARRLGLVDRGYVREGYVADLVLFDPERVRDRATFSDPSQTPDGILHVLVGGRFAIDAGERTGEVTGRFLRRHTKGQSL